MLLQLTNLNVWFGNQSATDDTAQHVLHDVSFQLERGQSLALVGESGSGKSVTALSILRLLEQSSRTTSSGSILFAGQDILQLGREEVRSIRGNRIAMIFQEPMSSLNPVYSIGQQMIEPLILHRQMSRHEAEQEAIRLLERTGITAAAARLAVFPHQLSGGQRQRVMIAMALACRPELLIADEPTTALDVTIQAQILDLIQDIQQEYGMALLLITHDLIMVRQIADHIAIMKDGRIVEQGETVRIFTAPQADYTRHLLAAVPGGEPIAKPPGPILLATKDLSCTFKLTGSWFEAIRGKQPILTALDGVNLSFPAGSTCGIVGESGSGKTTLAMAILRLLRSKGQILFAGQDLQQLSAGQMRPLRADIQIVFQDPFSSLSPRLTVAEIVGEGLQVHQPAMRRAERLAAVTATLAEVGLEEDMAFRYPHEFSGGQRQRIAIARVIILKPRLLILDEPTSALDVTIQAQILALLQDLQQRHGLTYLFISHDLRVIRTLADHLVVMQNGRIVEAGPAREVFTHPRQEYTKRLFSAALSRSG